MKSNSFDRDKAREAFSGRLNALLDHYGVPPKHDGRQVQLKLDLKVSQEASRKWLEGESIPREEKIISICKLYPCRKAWLQHGEGSMIEDELTNELLAHWDRCTLAERRALLGLLGGYGKGAAKP